MALLAEEAIVRGGGSSALAPEASIIALRPSSARCIRHQVKAFACGVAFQRFTARRSSCVSVVVGASFGWSSSSSSAELVNEGEVKPTKIMPRQRQWRQHSRSREGLGCGNAYAARQDGAKLTLENPIYIPLYAEAWRRGSRRLQLMGTWRRFF